MLHTLTKLLLPFNARHGSTQVDHGSLVGLCMQDYQSLRAAMTVYATMVNIHTVIQTHTDNTLTSLYEKLNH